MSIRHISIEDAESLFKLYAELDNRLPSQTKDAGQRLSRYIERLDTWPGSAILGYFEGNQLLGTYSLIVIPLLVHDCRQIGIIESVVVDQATRGQGIGRQLMNDAAQRGRAAGCYKLMLSSNLQRHHAHDFYAQLGFQRHGYSYHLDIEESEECTTGM